MLDQLAIMTFYSPNFLNQKAFRASLVAQWLRIRLPMQGTRVRSLVREDPACRGSTRPVCHNYWACALEPVLHNYWEHVPQLLSLCSRAHAPQLLRACATTTEACAPRARAPQREKPLPWEACTLQRRETRAFSSFSPQLEKARTQQRRPNTAKNK